MKKAFRQLKITVSLIIVFIFLLGCGFFTFREAEQQKRDFIFSNNDLDDLGDDTINYYYGIKTSYDMSSEDLNQEPGKGIGIIPAFYLSHNDNYINWNNVGFYSVLQNSKGEVVAEYQPYVIFEKDPYDQSKEDVRVLILGDEFSKSYYTGNLKTDKERYNFDARDILEDINVYGSKTTQWDNIGDCLRVDGTCDDSMVYLEKLTWYDQILAKTYTYSPKEKQTHKGSVNFEEWLDYKHNDVGVSVSKDVRSLSDYKSKLTQEAKEMCAKGIDIYKTDQIQGDNHSEGLLTYSKTNTRVIYDRNSDEYYIFSAAYVNHPLYDAIQNLYFEYLVALAIAVILIVLINVLFNKKRKLLEKSFVPAENKNNETDDKEKLEVNHSNTDEAEES